MQITRELELRMTKCGVSFARALLVGGSSRSYSGPAQASSHSVLSNIALTGSCHPLVCSKTNALTSSRGAFANPRASSSSTRTLSCHMLRGGVPLASFAASKGIVNILDRPSTV